MSSARPSRSRWHRMLMSVMGPAQVGSLDEPVTARPAGPDVCNRCGRLREEHTVVRDPGLTHISCPTD